MAKKLYLYRNIEVCNPRDEDSYHKDGGLVVITGGYAEDAVPRGTGNEIEMDGNQVFGLPAPDLVIDVSDYLDDIVIPFPNTGCC